VPVLERRLAQVTTIAEAKAVMDAAAALKALARRAHVSLTGSNRITLIGLLAEHRAGGLLACLERAPGARTDLQPAATLAGGSAYGHALLENGIAERTAQRWQHLARWLDEEEIHEAYTAACRNGEEFTRGAVSNLADWRRYEAARLDNAPTPNVSYNTPTSFRLGRNWLRPLPRRTTLHIEYDRLPECRRMVERLERIAYAQSPIVGRAGALELAVSFWEQAHGGTGG
jgi:hypothetical protein